LLVGIAKPQNGVYMTEVIIRKPQVDEYEVWAAIYRVYLDFYKMSLTDAQLQKVWAWLFE
jgi:hypothetical protein